MDKIDPVGPAIDLLANILSAWYGSPAHKFDRELPNFQMALAILKQAHHDAGAVERVARALFDDHWQDDPDLKIMAWSDAQGDCICEVEREAWRRSAQAALAAMKGPNNE